jgi:hypothetical protein
LVCGKKAFPNNDPGEYDVVDVKDAAECAVSCYADKGCTYFELVYGTQCWKYNVTLDTSAGMMDWETAELYEIGCFEK